MTTAVRRGGQTPAILLVIAGLACQEVGASFAVLLFPEVGPLGMVMLRLVFSALVLLAIARPRLRGHARGDWFGVLWFGVVLAVMNGLFYLALERFGYDITEGRKAVEAFQRRWRPERIDGVIDGEVRAILFQLLLDRDSGRTR